ncbi:glycosyltransferase family 4 protein [Nocardioides zeae]|nr:glycosyltransferase [Nocardioides zeae]
MTSIAGLPGRVFSSVLNILKGGRAGDVILVFSVWQLPDALIAKFLGRRRLILDFHETFSNRFMTLLLKVLIRLCAWRTIAPSFAVLETLPRWPQVHDATVVPRPVSLLPQARSLTKSAPIVIAIVGQVVEHKGVRELLELPWGETSTKLRIIGIKSKLTMSDYEAKVREIAESIGVEVVERTNDLAAALDGCSAVVNASRHEAFGRTLAEAAVLGLTPIAIGKDGPAEVIGEVGHGLIFENLEQFEVALLDGTLEKQIRETEREPMVLRARELFSPSTVGRRYWDLFGATSPDTVS